jgi:MFS family permease
VVADKPGVRRRRVAATGYVVTGLGCASFALAASWQAVAVGRAVAWSARGVRTPAREALLADAVDPAYLGRAFGLERAGDSIGAILGPLLAAVLLSTVGYRWVFAISALPAIAAALAILLLAREAPRLRSAAHHAAASIRDLAVGRGPFRSLLVGVGLYGLGNFSATLLILRATQILQAEGRPEVDAASIAVLLYAAHNAANALAASPAGAVADAVGRRHVLIAGVALFGAACIVFAFSPSSVVALAVLFVAIGASTALVETAEGSHAADLLPRHLRGRGFGALGLVDGVGDLVFSVVVGVLFTAVSPAAGFAYAAVLALAGAGVLAFAATSSRR